MTVQELIDKLQKQNPLDVVMIPDQEGGCLEAQEVRYFTEYPNKVWIEA